MRTRMACMACTLGGNYVRAETEHHHIYRADDLRVPLCDACHFLITTLNCSQSRVVGRKLTEHERLMIFISFCRDIANVAIANSLVGRIANSSAMTEEVNDLIVEHPAQWDHVCSAIYRTEKWMAVPNPFSRELQEMLLIGKTN